MLLHSRWPLQLDIDNIILQNIDNRNRTDIKFYYFIKFHHQKLLLRPSLIVQAAYITLVWQKRCLLAKKKVDVRKDRGSLCLILTVLFYGDPAWRRVKKSINLWVKANNKMIIQCLSEVITMSMIFVACNMQDSAVNILNSHNIVLEMRLRKLTDIVIF